MFTVLLVIHVLVTLALIGVVLIQRSEGGGLGIGGGQGMGSFMTGRGTANLLTRTTAILATVFLALSLLLALMTRNSTTSTNAIFNAPPPVTSTLPPLAPKPVTPPAPAKPAVPATP
jgi:preprotein translocase subunit SecG